MSYPNHFKNRQMQDLRLGIKSSYNKIRNTIALLYCIYLASGKEHFSNYGVPNGNIQVLAPNILNWIKNYLPNFDVDSAVSQSKLINSQIEAIQVCLELVFGLAKVTFNSSSTNLSERTGGNRYPKSLSFSSNILILDSIIAAHDVSTQKDFLKAWLLDNPCPDNPIESKVSQFLTLQSEKCILKMRFKNKEDLFFQQEGIYEILCHGANGVEISDDEKVGTYRVLNSFIGEGIHTYLTNSNGEIRLRPDKTTEDLKEYLSEVKIALDLSENRILSSDKQFTQNKYNTIDLSVDIKDVKANEKPYLRAMRTKPFLLLAGISGTGKSRIVKQMAFDSCPDNAILRKDPTSPGNYCLVEVKPNWHDSTELLGYESKIGGDHYQLTPFIKFLAKAMLHPEAPFFVCLDEMNLAPVEQYFAEYLSVLESRTKIDGHIVSEPLIKADIFKKYSLVNQLFSINKDNTSNEVANSTSDPSPNYGKEYEVYELLKKDGLRIPENVVIIGTVNMDETTHQFSRKVIDRAMTIEMNLPEGNPFMDFFSNSSELTYREQPTNASLYLATETKASDVVNALASVDAGKTEWLKGEIASFLTGLNNAIDGTPFKVAYRVQNELMLYFHQLWLEDQSAHWRDILNTACDQILMMKVLPRIEGDSELLEKPLTNLISFCAPYTNASKKLDEMNVRLDKSQFTSFWP